MNLKHFVLLSGCEVKMVFHPNAMRVWTYHIKQKKNVVRIVKESLNTETFYAQSFYGRLTEITKNDIVAKRIQRVIRVVMIY